MTPDWIYNILLGMVAFLFAMGSIYFIIEIIRVTDEERK